LTLCSLSTFSLSSRLFMLSRRSFRRTLREVLLDIYSRTSCSWRSLSPNFSENWKNMLLNAFLLTYVCGILLFFPVEDHEIRTPLSLSLSFSLLHVAHFLFFCWTSHSYPCSSSALHNTSLTRFTTVFLHCDLVLSYVILMCRSLWPE